MFSILSKNEYKKWKTSHVVTGQLGSGLCMGQHWIVATHSNQGEDPVVMREDWPQSLTSWEKKHLELTKEKQKWDAVKQT